MININKYDLLHLQVDTGDEDYKKEIISHFTTYVTGFRFMPQYKSGMWDGKICMFKKGNNALPYGLLTDFIRFHKKMFPYIPLNISQEVTAMYRGQELSINYDLNLQPYYYQKDCIETALKFSKGLIRSATASGKSLVIAYIIKILMDNNIIKNSIIVVPTTSLVEQFRSDLMEYGIDISLIGRVYEKFKEFDMPIVISTWQSLMRRHKVLDKYDCIIIDECHQAQSIEIRKIAEKCITAQYRIGFTGTMPTDKLDIWNVQSYLGPLLKEYPSGLLAEQGYISKCTVQVYNIEYHKEYEGEYDDVKNEIFTNPFRLHILGDILFNADHNILALVGKVEKEGQFLKDYLLRRFGGDKEIVFLSGVSDVQEREFWRKECENRNNLILIATYGIFSQGLNIPSLKYMAMASPYKSKIRILQSIGRTLRKHENKIDGSTVYDIVDKCKFLEEHGDRRQRYYGSEGFEVIETEFKENDQFFTT